MSLAIVCVIMPFRAVAYQSTQPTLVRAQSDAGSKAKLQKMASGQPPKLLRRHSSGDHAFLPDHKHREAIKASQKNFGVPSGLVQDGEGTRLPTTRGY